MPRLAVQRVELLRSAVLSLKSKIPALPRHVRLWSVVLPSNPSRSGSHPIRIPNTTDTTYTTVHTMMPGAGGAADAQTAVAALVANLALGQRNFAGIKYKIFQTA